MHEKSFVPSPNLFLFPFLFWNKVHDNHRFLNLFVLFVFQIKIIFPSPLYLSFSVLKEHDVGVMWLIDNGEGVVVVVLVYIYIIVEMEPTCRIMFALQQKCAEPCLTILVLVPGQGPRSHILTLKTTWLRLHLSFQFRLCPNWLHG